MMEPQTTLTFFNLGNPTGLKFAVEHRGARALFDFGREHDPAGSPFAQGLEPRPGRELDDLLAMGVAPRLDGVYDRWDGRTSLFLSHLHLDHTGLVPFVHPEVPLYYPAAMEDVRAACAEAGEVPWRAPAGTALADGARVRVGEIEVQAVAVDHDVPGATGYLIRTPELVIAYTGDHRWHGLRPELTAAYARAARGADVLVQEGVGLAWEEPEEAAPRLSEAEVHAAFEATLARTHGLLVVNLYPMNRERVAAFGAACRRQGRRLVMEPEAARIADWPGVLDDLEAVRRRPEAFCVQLGFRSLPVLLDLAPPAGSVYVHCDGPPLGPFDPAHRVMHVWIERLGLELLSLRSSGHSRRADIERMVGEVRPRVVIPVHSSAPERLQVPGVPSLLVRPWQRYTTADLLS